MTRQGWQAFRALLDKDIHESRVLILGFIILSAAGWLSLPAPGIDRYLRQFLPYAPAMLAVIWGAISGSRAGTGRRFESTHLPVGAYRLLLLSFGLPVLIQSAISELSLRMELLAGVGDRAVATPVVIGLFAFSHFVSSLSSQRTGLAAGMMAMVFGPASLRAYGPDPSLGAWAVAAVSSAAVLLSVALKGVVRLEVSRTICAGLVALAVVIPAAAGVARSVSSQDARSFGPHSYVDPDGAITVDAVTQSGKVQPRVAEFRNLRTGRACRRVFQAGWHPASVKGERFVYCLESSPTSSGAWISEWDTATGGYRVVTGLPAKPSFRTLCESGHFASGDRAGRWIMARLPAVRNASADLWLIDLKHGTARLLMQSAASLLPASARWLPDRCLVPSVRSRIIEVDLPEGTVVRHSRSGRAR